MAKSAQSGGRAKRRTGAERGADEGKAVPLVITHKPLLSATTALVRYVRSAESILHSSASPEEKAQLKNLVEDLNAAVAAVARIRCPNPMYSLISVDADRLGELDT